MSKIKSKVIVIAEAGINHNGKLLLAKKLVDVAKKCGADYVKFQTFNPNLITTSKSKLAPYQRKFISNIDKQKKLLRKLSLSNNEFIKLSKYCKKKKIKFLSSPFDIQSISFLKSNKFNLDYFKIPSGEITNYPYLKEIGKSKKKILLSTGMASIKEIINAKNVLIKNGTKKDNIILMHCISDYPTEEKNINLNFIRTLKKISKIVGFSDHSEGFVASNLAIAIGANVIEKHFTLNKTMKGPDHQMSLDPIGLKIFIKNLRNTEVILGKDKKIITVGEKILKKYARKSIVTKKKIKKGELFSKNNLTTKRPGDGKNPMMWNKIIGRKSKKNFNIDEKI